MQPVYSTIEPLRSATRPVGIFIYFDLGTVKLYGYSHNRGCGDGGEPGRPRT